MNTHDFLRSAREIEDEIIENRRIVHQLGGVGFDILPTTEFVVSKLREYGYQPNVIAQSGVVCTVGKGPKTIMLRADMDALPMREESGAEYACQNGSAHTCGHDAHTAMLLGAARMLKAVEDTLCGTVKLVFQPAEEIGEGARAMIDDHVLQYPNVDFAFALHNIVGSECPGMPTGSLRYTPGYTYTSNDTFEINITGRGCHGAKPNEGVDAITIGAKIVSALHELVAMEADPTKCAVITVGQFSAGTAPNVVSGEAVLRGTIRTYDQDLRQFLKRRLEQLCTSITGAFRGAVEVVWPFTVAPVFSDPEESQRIRRYYTEIMPEGLVFHTAPSMASEDFSQYGEHIPVVMVGLSLGCPEEGYDYGGHNPKMNINEHGLPVGAALYAQVAFRWLEEQGKGTPPTGCSA